MIRLKGTELEQSGQHVNTSKKKMVDQTDFASFQTPIRGVKNKLLFKNLNNTDKRPKNASLLSLSCLFTTVCAHNHINRLRVRDQYK